MSTSQGAKIILLDQAIEELLEQYRQRLEDDADLVAKDWLEYMDEVAEPGCNGEDLVLVIYE